MHTVNNFYKNGKNNSLQKRGFNMITPRLDCILKYVTEKTVADIGTDHAYIPIKLIQDGICDKVIASDIKSGPAEAAKHHISKYGFSSLIDVRIGAGLDPLKNNEAKQIIIAGMGGEMIINILTQNEEKAKNAKLILQPMNAQYELRKFLHKNNYTINSEDIAVEETKVYNILIASSGKSTPFKDDFEYHIPKYLLSNPFIDTLLAKKIREFRKILDGNNKAACRNEELIKRYEKYLKKAEIIKNESI